jgi:hypothetical protein
MYAALVIAHSWLRWLVLLTGVIALSRAAAGSSGRRPWLPADDGAGRWFVMMLDLQFVIGIILYVFLSPYTMPSWANMGEAMRDPSLRFWTVEHLLGMLVGTALIHIGRARIRKAPDSRRHKLALIFFGLGLLAIIASIPWPFMPAGRPLLRPF